MTISCPNRSEPIPRGVREEITPDGVRYIVSLRNTDAAIFMTSFALIWNGSIPFFSGSSGLSAWALVLLSIPFCFFGALSIVLAAVCWLGSARFELGPSGLRVRHGLGPIALHRRVALDQIRGFGYERKASTGEGKELFEHQLSVETPEKTHGFACGTEEPQARWVAARLNELFALDA
ncbi:MAG: hypothetical protein AAFR38_03495 [Planctomycetota bacterium]